MLGLLMLAAWVGSVAGTLYFIMGRIHRRAGATGASTVGPLVLGFFGYLLGTTAANFAGFGVLELVDPGGAAVGWFIFPIMMVSSLFGTVFGAGAGYMVLWARTGRDPDYEPLGDRPGRGWRS